MKTYRTAVLALLLGISMPAAMAAALPESDGKRLQQSPLPAADVETVGGSSAETPRRSRLRFRDGPVCMCPNGLSESDIAAGRTETQRVARDRAAP